MEAGDNNNDLEMRDDRCWAAVDSLAVAGAGLTESSEAGRATQSGRTSKEGRFEVVLVVHVRSDRAMQDCC